MYYESAPNPSYVVQPNNTQVVHALSTYNTPPQSSIRYLPNNGQRALQITPQVRSPVPFDQHHYYASSNSSLVNEPAVQKQFYQQPVYVVNNVQTNAAAVPHNPLNVEKVRVIGTHEKEFFKDGVSLSTILSSRFLNLICDESYSNLHKK